MSKQDKSFKESLKTIVNEAKETTKRFNDYPSSAEWNASTHHAVEAIIKLIEQEIIGEDEQLNGQSDFDKRLTGRAEADSSSNYKYVRQASRNLWRSKMREALKS